MSRRKEPAIPADLLDQLLAGSDAAAALDRGGLLDSLKKALAERALNAEVDFHLGGGIVFLLRQNIAVIDLNRFTQNSGVVTRLRQFQQLGATQPVSCRLPSRWSLRTQ